MDKIIKELAQYAKGLRVLFVEDDNDVRAEVTNLLAGFFNIVDSSINGQEGLNKYNHHNSPLPTGQAGRQEGIYYDIVISDIKMPVMDGIEMAKKIKRINSEQPIIMISAHDDSECLIDLINADIDKFLLKPIENQRLLSTLLQLCKVIVNKKQLFQYRSNLDAFFRSIKDAIITVDKEFLIVEVNDAAGKICGLLRKNVVGKKLESVLTGCNAKCIGSLKDTIYKGKTIDSLHLECHKKLRHKQIVSVTTFPLVDHNGIFSGGAMIIKDETRLQNLEHELLDRRQFYNFIGRSSKMQQVYTLIDSLADIRTNILITGETGTGKELVAEAFHYHKSNIDKPLVKVNCAGLPDDLLESELFGHVKGAFTGAIKDRIGRFQMADGGIIFLDEIGDISDKLQLRLLRVIQEMEFERLGESIPIKIDVRVIAATNKDLYNKVRHGKFREDLYYRLKVVELVLPPLRDRREDIPLLVDHLLKRFNKKLNKKIRDISEDVQNIFMNYTWPGNIRELMHILEHSMVVCHQHIITIDDLPLDFKDISSSVVSHFTKTKKSNKRQEIVQTLENVYWNKAKAARLLGISRGTLYQKIKEYDITRKQTSM